MKELKRLFAEQFSDHVFKMEDVEAFLEDHFQFDYEKAKKAALSRFSRSFIASYRSNFNGFGKVRDCFAYEDNGQIFYAFISSAETNVLIAQKKSLQRKRDGIERGIAKVNKHLEIAQIQTTILDFVESPAVLFEQPNL